MNHSFTDEQLLNLVNNTIRTKTEYDISDFTGGSVQITSTNNNQLMKYKVSLFFGYKQKNPISRTIDINEGLVYIWIEAIHLKCKALQAVNNGMDYSELNALMNNLSNEVANKEIESNKVVSISRGSTTTLTTTLTTEEEEDKIPYKEIIEHLNNALGTNYKHTAIETRKLIKARFNQGFSIEDFKTVIDKKVLLWGKDLKMSAYLRPETLFSNKFEGYLNEIITQAKFLVANGVMSQAGAKALSIGEEWANE